VVLNDLRLELSEEEVYKLLADAGFRVVEVSLVGLARSQIGVSAFVRRVQSHEAPARVDCSSFVKWLYAQVGVWIPRRTIQQWSFGRAVDLADVVAGDLVFTRGGSTFYTDDEGVEVGHVGLATGEGTVIQAANAKRGIVEDELLKFCTHSAFCGVRRIVPMNSMLTLEVPDYRDIETSDDLRWLILSSQMRK
jgi:hypothetical protein